MIAMSDCKCNGDYKPEGSAEALEALIKKMMKESAAHLEGHFQLTSGLHSGDYLQCALMLRFPERAALAGEKLAEKLAPFKPEIILSPALGGLIIGHEAARALGVPHIFCERQEGEMKLRRFPHPGNVRFALVEDVVTTGKSSYETAALLTSQGAGWVAWGAVVDRRPADKKRDMALQSLWKTNFPVYEPGSCPLCAAGVPLVKPGSRPEAK